MRAIEAAMHGAHGAKAFSLLLCGMLVMALPTLAFMIVQIAIIYFFAKLKMRGWQSLLSLVVCVGLAAILWIFGRSMAGNYGFSRILMSIFLMFAAASLGYMVSLRVTDRNLLLPVVMFAAYIDFWTVTRGPVATMIQHAPKIVEAVSTPIPSANAQSFTPIAMIGPGDFIFMALVFAVVHRLGLNARRNYAFVACLMTLGMLAVVFDFIPFLPALIALAVAVIAANWREFKLSRQEKISTAIVGVLLAASLPLVWSLLKPKPEVHMNVKQPPVQSKAKK